MAQVACTVILLGLDTPIGLAVIRDLGRHGYKVVGLGRSATALASTSRYCEHYLVRAAGEDQLIEQLIVLAGEYSASCLLAISESDLMMLNRHRVELESALTILVPSGDRLQIVLDKSSCQNVAESVGIPIPPSYQISDVSELDRVASEIGFPVVLKWADPNLIAPALSRAGIPLIKAEYALDHEQLQVCMDRYASVGRFPLIQQYCSGHGVGQMFLARDGEVLIEFQHERLHEWPPEGGTSALCRSVPLTEYVETREKSKALLRALNWTGVAMVEYRYDPATGGWAFMEINGRFWGSLPLATAASVPFASGLVAAIGQNRAVPEFLRPYPELKCCYWIPFTKALIRVLFNRSAIRDPLFRVDRWRIVRDYVSSYVNPRSKFFVFDMSDPRPFVTDMLNIARKLTAAISRVSR
jgi:predicted ATP-grasp superfamily ATP-dependent carboligase